MDFSKHKPDTYKEDLDIRLLLAKIAAGLLGTIGVSIGLTFSFYLCAVIGYWDWTPDIITWAGIRTSFLISLLYTSISVMVRTEINTKTGE